MAFLKIVTVLGVILAVNAGVTFPRRKIDVVDEDTRIIGGKLVTEPGKYPFIAALQHIKFNDDGAEISRGAFCGGSIIQAQWVLTAAHCAKMDDPDVWITAGSHNITVVDDPNAQTVKVVKIIWHPLYDITSYIIYDVSLFRLEKPLTFNQFVQPIPMAESGFIAVGNGKVIGWGNQNDTGVIQGTEDLREVEGEFHDRKDCPWHQVSTEHTQVCMGKYNQTSCQGDSGGPLVKETDNGHILVGIVSHGYPSCVGEGIFTRVAAFVDTFINPMIKQYESGALDAAEEELQKGLSQAPFVVSIHVYPKLLSSVNEKICTGSIVHEEWILTSAGCLNSDDTYGNGLYAVIGVDNPFDIYDTFARRTIRVDKVVLHPHYQGHYLDHDVALLHLSEPIIMKGLVRKLNLPTTASYQTVGRVFTSEYALRGDAFGYGVLKQNDLFTAEAEMEDIQACQKYHTLLTNDNGLCIKAPKVHICGMDIGGPLYDESDTLIGIATQKTEPCGLAPEVYGKITNDLLFIQQTIQ